MPELPEVETVRKALLSKLKGKTIKDINIIHNNVFEKQNLNEVVKNIKEFLINLLKNLGFQANIEVKVTDNIPKYTIFSDNDSLLIGKNGKNLQALSIITSQYIKKEVGNSYKFILDVNAYKESIMK